MSKPFIVVGMPFTRMAWLAAFLTTNKTLCYCEPNLGIRSIEQLAGLLESDYYHHVGAAGTGLGFYLDYIMKHIKPHVVIVDMPREEVDAYMQRFNLPPNSYQDHLRSIVAAYRTHPDVLWVPAAKVLENRIIQRIYWHLMPGEAFDESRFNILSTMVIEQSYETVAQSVVESQKAPSPMIKEICDLVRSDTLH